MRATYMYGAGDVRVIDVPDPTIQRRPTPWCGSCGPACAAATCTPTTPWTSIPTGRSMGHEFIGVVEDDRFGCRGRCGVGDFVIAPFAVSCGTCVFCACGSADLVRAAAGSGMTPRWVPRVVRPRRSGCRWPTARWSRCRWREDADDALLDSVLTLSDVYGTGWHAAVRGGVGDGQCRDRDR